MFNNLKRALIASIACCCLLAGCDKTAATGSVENPNASFRELDEFGKTLTNYVLEGETVHVDLTGIPEADFGDTLIDDAEEIIEDEIYYSLVNFNVLISNFIIGETFDESKVDELKNNAFVVYQQSIFLLLGAYLLDNVEVPNLNPTSLSLLEEPVEEPEDPIEAKFYEVLKGFKPILELEVSRQDLQSTLNRINNMLAILMIHTASKEAFIERKMLFAERQIKSFDESMKKKLAEFKDKVIAGAPDKELQSIAITACTFGYIKYVLGEFLLMVKDEYDKNIVKAVSPLSQAPIAISEELDEETKEKLKYLFDLDFLGPLDGSEAIEFISVAKKIDNAIAVPMAASQSNASILVPMTMTIYVCILAFLFFYTKTVIVK